MAIDPTIEIINIQKTSTPKCWREEPNIYHQSGCVLFNWRGQKYQRKITILYTAKNKNEANSMPIDVFTMDFNGFVLVDSHNGVFTLDLPENELKEKINAYLKPKGGKAKWVKEI